jgi:hypothetical protein
MPPPTGAVDVWGGHVKLAAQQRLVIVRLLDGLVGHKEAAVHLQERLIHPRVADDPIVCQPPQSRSTSAIPMAGIIATDTCERTAQVVHELRVAGATGPVGHGVDGLMARFKIRD